MNMSEVMAAPMPTGAFVAPMALALSESALATTISIEEPSECRRAMGLYGAEDEMRVDGAVRAWKAELPLINVAGCFSNSTFLKDLRTNQDSLTAVDQIGVAGAILPPQQPDRTLGMFAWSWQTDVERSD